MAPVLKDSAARSNRGDVETGFDIFPVHDFFTSSRNHNHVFQLSIAKKLRRRGL